MWRIAALIIVTLTITLQVHAKQKTPKNHETPQAITEKQLTVGNVSFGPAERNLIRAHLLSPKIPLSKHNDKKLPPGLQKEAARRKSLPPGWQEKLALGKTLDYHIYRQGESLPDALLQRLPPSPTGTDILRVEDKIIRLNSATRTILDAFDLTPTR